MYNMEHNDSRPEIEVHRDEHVKLRNVTIMRAGGEESSEMSLVVLVSVGKVSAEQLNITDHHGRALLVDNSNTDFTISNSIFDSNFSLSRYDGSIIAIFRDIGRRSYPGTLFVNTTLKCPLGHFMSKIMICLPCRKGEYSLEHGEATMNGTSEPSIRHECNTCPRGGVCHGKTTVTPKYNFWGRINSTRKIKFYDCPYGQCCDSEKCPKMNKPNECPAHKTGKLCSKCDKGWYLDFDTLQCVFDHCPKPLAAAILILMVLVSVAIPIFYHVEWKTVSQYIPSCFTSVAHYLTICLSYLKSYFKCPPSIKNCLASASSETSIFPKLPKPSTSSLALVVFFYQTLDTLELSLGLGGENLTSTDSSIMAYMHLLNFNVASICPVKTVSYTAVAAYQFGLSVAFTASVNLLHVITCKHLHKGGWFCFQCNLTVRDLVYMIVLQILFRLVVTVEIEGSYFLFYDASVCSGQWFQYSSYILLVLIMVPYAIVTPFLFVDIMDQKVSEQIACLALMIPITYVPLRLWNKNKPHQVNSGLKKSVVEKVINDYNLTIDDFNRKTYSHKVIHMFLALRYTFIKLLLVFAETVLFRGISSTRYASYCGIIISSLALHYAHPGFTSPLDDGAELVIHIILILLSGLNVVKAGMFEEATDPAFLIMLSEHYSTVISWIMIVLFMLINMHKVTDYFLSDSGDASSTVGPTSPTTPQDPSSASPSSEEEDNVQELEIAPVTGTKQYNPDPEPSTLTNPPITQPDLIPTPEEDTVKDINLPDASSTGTADHGESHKDHSPHTPLDTSTSPTMSLPPPRPDTSSHAQSDSLPLTPTEDTMQDREVPKDASSTATTTTQYNADPTPSTPANPPISPIDTTLSSLFHIPLADGAPPTKCKVDSTPLTQSSISPSQSEETVQDIKISESTLSTASPTQSSADPQPSTQANTPIRPPDLSPVPTENSADPELYTLTNPSIIPSNPSHTPGDTVKDTKLSDASSTGTADHGEPYIEHSPDTPLDTTPTTSPPPPTPTEDTVQDKEVLEDDSSTENPPISSIDACPTPSEDTVENMKMSDASSTADPRESGNDHTLPTSTSSPPSHIQIEDSAPPTKCKVDSTLHTQSSTSPTQSEEIVQDIKISENTSSTASPTLFIAAPPPSTLANTSIRTPDPSPDPIEDSADPELSTLTNTLSDPSSPPGDTVKDIKLTDTSTTGNADCGESNDQEPPTLLDNSTSPPHTPSEDNPQATDSTPTDLSHTLTSTSENTVQ